MTKKSKLRVGVLFGGRSAEHEVSLCSAKNVVEALDPEKYEVVLIGIDKTGEWRLRDAASYLLHADSAKLIQLKESEHSLALVPQKHRKELMQCTNQELTNPLQLDVIFPILHGTYGEDGTVQGLLKMANIPFVGPGVLSSAMAMDKDITKRLLRDAGILVARFVSLHSFDRERYSFAEIAEQLGVPFFLKPANLGSSVGISKVKTEADFHTSLERAFLYDRKVLAEEFIEGREIECAVLGNEHPMASLPGEIIPQHEFYSYEAKYLDDEGAKFEIPVALPLKVTQEVQELAIKTYRTLCCEGMARVDFFLKPCGTVYVNEINTIPGFTQISMYPKLWIASGLTYTQLLDKLIELALERHQKEEGLKTDF